MADLYLYDGYDGARVTALAAPPSRPLRGAAWHPEGSWALIAGNRGQVLRLEAGGRVTALASGSAHNLRGVAWSPDGRCALLAGNRGAVLAYEDGRFTALPSPTVENLRRVAWSPDGSCALVVGNAGVVLRYDPPSRALAALPGDRAHTLRSVAWRPDGAYALIGAYASRFAGYPRPHALYRCDGRFSQAVFATDDEDDAVAVSWRPGATPASALVLVVAYRDGRAVNKIVTFDGAGFSGRTMEAPGALLGAAWAPDGSHALLAGEHGALFRCDDAGVTPVASGTRDHLIGPFWRPGGAPLALMLKGPQEKTYTA
jgi:hypothetical protein